MARNDSFEKVFDLIIKESSTKVLEEEAEQLLSEEVIEHEFSIEHKKKMEKLFKKPERTFFVTFVKKHKSLAAVLIILVMLACVSVPNTKAIKSVFMNYIFEKNASGTAIRFNEDEHQSYGNKKFFARYIPSNFEKINENITDSSLNIVFQNGEKWFDFYMNDIDGKLTIDTEGAIVEEIDINGTKAILSIKPDVKILVWSSDNYSLVMSGNIYKETLIKIAKSITVLE